jgi:hypothetical protein
MTPNFIDTRNSDSRPIGNFGTAGASSDIPKIAQVLVGAFFLFLAEFDLPFVPLPFPGRCGM